VRRKYRWGGGCNVNVSSRSVNVWTRCFGIKIRPMASCCEDGNEISGSIKRRGFLDWLNNYQLKKASAMELWFKVVSLLPLRNVSNLGEVVGL
jgi:hypothetical protein